MILEGQYDGVVIVDEGCIRYRLDDILKKYGFCECEPMFDDGNVVGSIVNIELDASTALLQCHLVHLALGIRVELVARQIRIVRRVNVVILHLLSHVLINFRFLGFNYAVVWRKYVVAETEEGQTVAFLFLFSSNVARHIVKIISIG